MKRLRAWAENRLIGVFKEVCDEGVRLGIGAAIRCVEELADEDPTYDGREALREAATVLRGLSVEYGAP